MQFTVLIEFLVTGLATTLLALGLLSVGEDQLAPSGLPASETLTVLVLLAISYPVGILTNFAAFLVQRQLLTPRIQRQILEHFKLRGFDLTDLASQRFGYLSDGGLPLPSDLRDFFGFLRTVAVSGNVERLNVVIAFQEGLQRFARGMLLPLLLASALVLASSVSCPWIYLLVFGILFGLAVLLLRYSLANEETNIVRFFVVLSSTALPTEIGSAPAGKLS